MNWPYVRRAKLDDLRSFYLKWQSENNHRHYTKCRDLQNRIDRLQRLLHHEQDQRWTQGEEIGRLTAQIKSMLGLGALVAPATQSSPLDAARSQATRAGSDQLRLPGFLDDLQQPPPQT